MTRLHRFVLVTAFMVGTQANAFDQAAVPEYDRPDCVTEGAEKTRAKRYEKKLRFCSGIGKLRIWHMDGRWLRSEITAPVLLSSSDQSLMDSYQKIVALSHSVRALQEVLHIQDHQRSQEVGFNEIVATIARIIDLTKDLSRLGSKKKQIEVTIMSLETGKQHILRFPAKQAHLVMKALIPIRRLEPLETIPSQCSVTKL